VVENHVAAIAQQIDGDIALVSGGRNDGIRESTLAAVNLIDVPLIDYDVMSTPDRSLGDEGREGLLNRIASTTEAVVAGLAERGLDADNTVLHWHNHSLGKNVATPGVIKCLSARFGFRQLLQIHDFAEDFRPENYVNLAVAAQTQSGDEASFSPLAVNRYLYPQSPAIHYAALTSADAELLEHVGVARQRRHVLPNSVALGDPPSIDPEEAREKLVRARSLPADTRWCVYPVRGIRRKNVGEFLLLSRLLPQNMRAGITLPPTTKIERLSYERWRQVATEVAPRAVFDAGTIDDVSFMDNLIASQFILSSSAAEGFGMAFLEPWLVRRGVIARRLPDVVRDFQATGMTLDHFYDAIWIPGDASWREACVRETDRALIAAWKPMTDRFGTWFSIRSGPQSEADDAIDFGTLTPRRQIEVLRRMHADVGFGKAISERNPALADHLAGGFDVSVLTHNQSVVKSEYSLARCGERLSKIYHCVASANQADAGRQTGTSRVAVDASPIGDRSLVEVITRRRQFYPCRTETEIVT